MKVVGCISPEPHRSSVHIPRGFRLEFVPGTLRLCIRRKGEVKREPKKRNRNQSSSKEKQPGENSQPGLSLIPFQQPLEFFGCFFRWLRFFVDLLRSLFFLLRFRHWLWIRSPVA